MNEADHLSLEERLARIEQRLADIEARGSAPRGDERREPQGAAAPRYAPVRNPLAGRSLEWWLARGGAILTSLALVLLYDYAVEKNWITPVIRVLFGVAIGAALFYSAHRFTKRDTTTDVAGVREVLLGAGLAAWYITAYAAAIFYALIPVSAARLLFLALTVLGAWLALSEQRSVLGLLALGVGFLTPVLLPSSYPFVPAFALYLGALTAVGLVLYLMRGWQSILWLTFIAFWWSTGAATELVCCEQLNGFVRIVGSPQAARIALTILVLLGGAALVRTPLLRRKLVASGSTLYTQPARSEQTEAFLQGLARRIQSLSAVQSSLDSPSLWAVTIISPLVSVLILSWIWTSVEGTLWGVASLLIAAVMYRLATGSSSDEEFTHVEATAAAIWSLAGVLWLADAAGTDSDQSSAFVLFAAASHAFFLLQYVKDSKFRAARAVALATMAFALASVIIWETMLRSFATSGFDATWTIAELAVVTVALWTWWHFRRPAELVAYPTLFGIASFSALMLMDARLLGRVWPPLVTASFALAGTIILVAGRERADAVTLRRIGGFTLVVVLIRLFMIDLARVETIWRVLLFLVCGALFLFTSHRLQSPRTSQSPDAPA